MASAEAVFTEARNTPPLEARTSKGPSRMERLVAGRCAIVRFADMPVPYQLAIAFYMAIDSDAWEAPSAFEGLGLPQATAALVQSIGWFAQTYADCHYGMAEIPTDDLIASVMQDEELHDDFPDWQAYQDWYLGYNDTPAYPEAHRWPVILSNYDDETLQDGWHRFHSYVRDGATSIPVVFYPQNAGHRTDSLI